MKQEPGKRIVSKREYVKAQGRRAVLGLVGGSFLLMLAPCAVFLVYCFCMLWCYSEYAEGIIVSIALLYIAMYFGSTWGSKSLRTAIFTDPGVPLTRANAATLPAPDSLVRASQEPMQAQETILLRAAIEGQEIHAEQLLRATTGGQEC